MKLNSLEDTFNLSKKIGRILSNGDIIFLYGEIGTGKTTFVRNLINNLEINNQISKSEVLSPTFNIVFDYKIKKMNIMHYDLYRLSNVKDIDELGIFSEVEDNIILIEWPNLIKKKPKDRIELLFKHSKNLDKRFFQIKGYGKWKKYDFKKI